ncbi:tetratricopeptide repeat protein [Aquirhabdus parva]|nr:tetratricopeptide repeat protein [Aquirhabdus parva]
MIKRRFAHTCVIACALLFAQGMNAAASTITTTEDAAIQALQKAASEGDVYAQRDLGYRYRDGLGVAANPTTAYEYFLQAAQQGDRDAMATVAEIYRMGQGTETNPTEAFNWYKKAAESGDPMSQFALALLYKSGSGTEVNIPEAIRWYRQSAEQGVAAAQYNLSYMTATGHDLPKDYVEAYSRIIIVIALAGDRMLLLTAMAKDTKSFLAARMTKPQIKRAKLRAAAWLADHPPAEYANINVQRSDTTQKTP